MRVSKNACLVTRLCSVMVAGDVQYRRPGDVAAGTSDRGTATRSSRSVAPRRVRLMRALVVGCVVGIAAAGSPKAESPTRPVTKVGAELTAAYETYRTAGVAGADALAARGLRVLDGRVLIDAIAVEDGAALGTRLESLGATHVAVAGRVVSGYVPIEAIPALDTLPGLRWARPAALQTRPPGGAQSKGSGR